MAPARCRRGRRRGNRGAAFLRSLDVQPGRFEQRSLGHRSRRAAADPGRPGPALFTAAVLASWRHHRLVSATGSVALSVAIIDYGSGNLHSAAKAFERAARSMDSPEKIVVTRDPET